MKKEHIITNPATLLHLGILPRSFSERLKGCAYPHNHDDATNYYNNINSMFEEFNNEISNIAGKVPDRDGSLDRAAPVIHCAADPSAKKGFN